MAATATTTAFSVPYSGGLPYNWRGCSATVSSGDTSLITITESDAETSPEFSLFTSDHTKVGSHYVTVSNNYGGSYTFEVEVIAVCNDVLVSNDIALISMITPAYGHVY